MSPLGPPPTTGAALHFDQQGKPSNQRAGFLLVFILERRCNIKTEAC